MILYTHVPLEQVFPADYSSAQQSLITVNGVPLLVEKGQESFRVVRVMSCNPSDYLREDFTPGSELPLTLM
ncbi:YlzJ-like family protein [Mangrovibacillus cuniculi]|uniref:Ribonuclease n=1 Tax=Mangrovibacillus cuniculi TaxID=2593652 RepID=A0A7S8HF02_9BACI|nr:YlzJ-like family protein [Mangrovibacillus cuniculi]QPC46399.1 ribonuclease [Mangrovibacillus cuniculi]